MSMEFSAATETKTLESCLCRTKRITVLQNALPS